jgi:hypothetical protein
MPEEVKADWEGLREVRDGIGKVGSGVKHTATEAGSKYTGFVARSGERAARAVGSGTRCLDGLMGDAPWKLARMDERNIRIARSVLRDVVPKTAGDRVSSMLDGLAIKAGTGGVGIALRLPLKPIIAPILLAMGAIETVKAVKDVRKGVSDVAARVDAEIAAETPVKAMDPA